MARVDIDGNHCRLVWENDSITVTDEVHKLSTKTGLIYAIGRKWDPTFKYPNGDDLDVYYFTAIDFRTGQGRLGEACWATASTTMASKTC